METQNASGLDVLTDPQILTDGIAGTGSVQPEELNRTPELEEVSATSQANGGSSFRPNASASSAVGRQSDPEPETSVEETLCPPPGLQGEHGETQSLGEARSSPTEQAEGSCLPAVTRDDCTPVESEAVSNALPTEERIRQMERHKKRKEAGLDKFATKKRESSGAAFRRLRRGSQLDRRHEQAPLP